MTGKRGIFGSGAVRLGAVALAALLSACASDQTASFMPPTTPLPAEAPRVTGVQRAVDREHQQLVKAFGGEVRSPPLQALLAEVTGRLVPATERPDEGYRVTILDSAVVNAFALPNGRLYVTRGLLALANDVSEVAGVLAHEIAHVSLRHASARSEAELRSALVSRVAADLLKDPAAGAMLQEEARYTIASFSRAQELEADEIGVKTLASAGFDPYGAARFLASLGRATALKNGPEKRGSPDMLSTHPSTPERVALALQAARRQGAPGLIPGERERYLAALDGLSYGEDPADGVVRGRRFLHGRLGIAFEAPAGITLENTTTAVLGANASGDRRLLFDVVAGEDGQALTDVLVSNWGETIDPGSLETLEVNGLQAVTGTTQGRDWSFRLAAIRAGERTYRLIVAGRALDAELERAFQGALTSVRRLQPGEASGVRPLRLAVVRAAPGETAADLAARMATTDRALERFLVLNGLERGAAVVPGERYKIVVE